MNPILNLIKDELIHSPKSKVFQHMGASRISGEFYSNKKFDRIWSLVPYSDNYYSILNPIFSKLFLELNEKEHQYPIVTLRDGTVDLFEFVSAYPDPTFFDQKFLIHQDLAKVLPVEWLKDVMLFDFYHLPMQNYRLKMNRKKLIISTIVNGAYIDLDQAQNIFTKLKLFADEKKLEIILHFPIRENLYFESVYKDQNPAFEISLLAYDIFGTQVKILSDKALRNCNDFRDSYYALIPDDKLCISDNYIEHFLLMNGAAPWRSFASIDGAYKIPLSRDHGVFLFDAVEEHYKSSLFKKLNDEFKSDLLKKDELKKLSLGDVDFFHRFKAIVNSF